MRLELMKATVGFAIFVALTTGSVGVSRSSEIERLAWMAGDWECDLEGGKFQETWLPPAGGTMQGVGRHLKDGQTTFMEFMSIEPDKSGGVTMYILLGAPSRGDKKPRPFKLTHFGPDRAVFELPENEFPSRIEYSRKPGESLFCRISGKPGGKEAHRDYKFTVRK